MVIYTSGNDAGNYGICADGIILFVFSFYF